MPPFRSNSCNSFKDTVHRKSIFGKIVCVAALLFLGLPLVGCGDADPDCGSSATQDLVFQIMKEHPNNPLLTYAIGRSDSVKKSVQQSMESVPSIQQNIKTIEAKIEEGGIERQSHARELVELQSKYADERQKAAANTIEQAKEAASYKLDTIRVDSNDANTKAVLCTAKLYVQLEDSGAQKEISYTVEKTTDGKLYATIVQF
jgi:hypothetical protein